MNKEIGDDDLVSLAEAARLFFGGRLTKSALRTEAKRGKLEIIRIANRDFVTKSAIQRMIERCAVRPTAPVVAPKPPRGIASQEAVRLRLEKLKRE